MEIRVAGVVEAADHKQQHSSKLTSATVTRASKFASLQEKHGFVIRPETATASSTDFLVSCFTWIWVTATRLAPSTLCP